VLCRIGAAHRCHNSQIEIAPGPLGTAGGLRRNGRRRRGPSWPISASASVRPVSPRHGAEHLGFGTGRRRATDRHSAPSTTRRATARRWSAMLLRVIGGPAWDRGGLLMPGGGYSRQQCHGEFRPVRATAGTRCRTGVDSASPSPVRNADRPSP
jgi:hypothetical protein